MKYKILYCILATMLFAACNQESNPRPVAYPRIYFPEKEFKSFNSDACDYSFEIPVYSEMEKDAKYTDGGLCWYNLVFKPFDATLHLSYHNYHSPKEYDSLYEDTRKMAYKHIVRADDIEELEIESINGNLDGVIFQIKGNTASNFNFFITDKDSRYLRGALYFNYKTNNDSIAPIFKFLQEDVLNLIATFNWK
jgi:gliding motility-associated lipoprotein GldD